MRLTRECDYAFVVLVFLADQDTGRVISCDALAELLTMPYDFLAKILQKLSRTGLIGSKHGPYGGYYLARNPSQITFTDVFRAIDDPVRLVECVELETCHCPRLHVCAIIDAMRAVHQKLIAGLDRVTIADLIQAYKKVPSPVYTQVGLGPATPG